MSLFLSWLCPPNGRYNHEQPKIILQKELIYMKEITFVYPSSKLTRTIKVCETQKELINLIRERRALNNGYVYVIYKDGGYFYQLLGSSGYKVNQFKRCGIMSATVSSSSGELFVFGDFAITPNDRICIGKAAIATYGSYSGQYDVKPEVETNTYEIDFDEMRQAYNEAIDNLEYNMRPIDKIRQAYDKVIDDIKHNPSYCIDEKFRQCIVYSKIKQLDCINHLWEHGVYYDVDGFFSRKVNSYNLKTGDFDITVEPPEPPYYYDDDDYNLISSEPEAAIRFALYLLGR